MSQYLIIFLIVAVFRGVVWVVQKAQQSAKARDALLAQQREGTPLETAGQARTTQPERAAVAAPSGAPKPARMPAPARAQAARDAQAARKVEAARDAQAARKAQAATRASVPAPARGQRTSTRGLAVGNRGAVVSRRGGSARATIQPSAAPPASRTELREARVDQSSRDVRKLLRDRSSLRQALLAREILGPPRGLSV